MPATLVRPAGEARNQSWLNARADHLVTGQNGSAGAGQGRPGSYRRPSCSWAGSGAVRWSPVSSTPRPSAGPVADRSTQDTAHRAPGSSCAASSASRSPSLRVVTRRRALRIRSSRSRTLTMTPVRPMPPTVARKAGVPGRTVRRAPSPSSSSIVSIQTEMEPSACWFLPCTSAATAPPTVRCLVPGSTGGSRPDGTLRASRSVKVTEALARTAACSGSSSICLAVTGSSTTPPAFWAASP